MIRCGNCRYPLIDADLKARRCPLCTSDSHEPDASALDESLVDMHRAVAALDSQLKELAQRAEAMQEENERLKADNVLMKAREDDIHFIATRTWGPDTLTLRRVKAVLAAFYRAPLTLSSVQPLLALAEELNPRLKESK